MLCGWPKGVAGVDAAAKLKAEELAAGVAKLKVEPAAALLAPAKLNAMLRPQGFVKDIQRMTGHAYWHSKAVSCAAR